MGGKEEGRTRMCGLDKGCFKTGSRGGLWRKRSVRGADEAQHALCPQLVAFDLVAVVAVGVGGETDLVVVAEA